MKFDYEDEELTVYEDSEELGGDGCLLMWQSEKGICMSVSDDYQLKEIDDGYGGHFYKVIKKGKNVTE